VVKTRAANPGGRDGLGPGGDASKGRVKAAVDARRAKRSQWDRSQQDVHRWQLAVTAPLFAGAGTWVYGQCTHAIAEAADAPVTTAGYAALGAAIGVFVVRYGLRKVFVKRWSMRYYLAGMVATAWSAAAAMVGPTPLLTALLAVSAFLLGGNWYREHRLSVRPARVPKSQRVVWRRRDLVRVDDSGDLVADEDDELDDFSDNEAGSEIELATASKRLTPERIVEVWNDKIARKRLAGSTLTLTKRLPNSVQFDVQLDPDENQDEDLPGVMRFLAGQLKLAESDLIPERHPSRDASRATLTVVTSNPLTSGIPYKGPRYLDGWVGVGLLADGSGWGEVCLADHKNSVFNGLVCGDPGSGKSVFLENLGMSALHSGKWKVLFCDGSEDADSSTLLSDYMTWSEAGIAGAWRQLKAIKHYMTGRGKENKKLPKEIRGVNPSSERVAVLWIIDELHRLLADPKTGAKFAAELEQVLRLARKKGVAIWAATQGLELTGDFAGNAMIRTVLTSKNVVAFYSASKYSHTLINGPTIAPHTLPMDGGYALLAGVGAKRGAMLRTDFADDMTPWAEGLDDAFDFDPTGKLLMGPFIAHYSQTLDERRAESDADFAAFLAQPVVLDGIVVGGDGVSMVVEADGPTRDVSVGLPGFVIPTVPSLDELRARRAEILAEQQALESAQTRELNEADRAVLVAARNGVVGRGAYVTALDGSFAERTVDGALKRMYEAGYLEKANGKAGFYVLTAFAKERESEWMTGAADVGSVGA
jgi:hypothetical protein